MLTHINSNSTTKVTYVVVFIRLGNILWLDPLVERQNLGETRTIINKAYVHRELITNGFADDNPNVSSKLLTFLPF